MHLLNDYMRFLDLSFRDDVYHPCYTDGDGYGAGLDFGYTSGSGHSRSIHSFEPFKIRESL